MRALTKWVLLLVLAAAGWSFGQPPADRGDAGKRSLDELLATALRHSPDVQVAQAKVREAEAELRRTRLTLLQKVIETNSAVEAQRAAVAHAEAVFQRLQKLAKQASVSMDEVQRAEAQLAAAKAQLAQAEATLNALTGTLPAGVGALAGGGEGVGGAVLGLGVMQQPAPVAGGNPAGIPGLGGAPNFPGVGMPGMMGGMGMGTVEPPRVPQGPIADKLRAALDSPVKVTPVKDKPLAEVLGQFRAAAKGVPFLLHLGDKAKEPVSLSLEGDIPLGAVFQGLEDVVPGLKVFVREYGLLITEEGSGSVAFANGIPLVEFWRLKQEKAGAR